jgi:hypothetical protein
MRAPPPEVPAVIDHERPVRVFKNWKHDCYSIMQDGVVRASARQVLLHDVQFLVRESGRRRMLELQCKTVHAYAVGRLQAHVHPEQGPDLAGIRGRKAFYDPYRFASFVDRESLQPVREAAQAFLDESGLTYCVESVRAAA